MAKLVQKLVLAAFLTAAVVVPPRQVAADWATEEAVLKAATAAVGETQQLKALEPKALAVSRGRATRTGQTLVLRRKKGPAIVLKARNRCESGSPTQESCRSFVLMADLPSQHCYIVAVTYYEGIDILLIDDRTGRQTKLRGTPSFAPDGAYFLVVDNNEAYGTPGLELWRRQGDGAELEWTHRNSEDPVEHLTEVVAWGGDVIELDMRSTDYRDSPDEHWRGRVRRSDSGWQLEADWPSQWGKLFRGWPFR
jgi:hypothetical protein